MWVVILRHFSVLLWFMVDSIILYVALFFGSGLDSCLSLFSLDLVSFSFHFSLAPLIYSR